MNIFKYTLKSYESFIFHSSINKSNWNHMSKSCYYSFNLISSLNLSFLKCLSKISIASRAIPRSIFLCCSSYAETGVFFSLPSDFMNSNCDFALSLIRRALHNIFFDNPLSKTLISWAFSFNFSKSPNFITKSVY